MRNQLHIIRHQATMALFAIVDISEGYPEETKLAPWEIISILVVAFVFLYALALFVLARPWRAALAERKAAKKLQRKAILENEVFSHAAKSSDDGIVIADSDGGIIWMNDGFTRMTGYTLQKWKELRGGTILESSFNIHIMAVMADVLRTKQPITYETSLYTRDSKKLWMRSTVIPVFGEKEDLKNYIIIDKDITYIKELEEELKKHKDAIEFLTSSERAQSVQLE